MEMVYKVRDMVFTPAVGKYAMAFVAGMFVGVLMAL